MAREKELKMSSILNADGKEIVISFYLDKAELLKKCYEDIAVPFVKELNETVKGNLVYVFFGNIPTISKSGSFDFVFESMDLNGECTECHFEFTEDGKNLIDTQDRIETLDTFVSLQTVEKVIKAIHNIRDSIANPQNV